MRKFTRLSTRIENPYSFLALNVFYEAFRTIECYFNQEGSKEEIEEGKKSLDWMIKMRGNFQTLARATNLPLDKFHQLCIWKINKIRKKAYVNQDGTSGKAN
jgi:hypothetical protein